MISKILFWIMLYCLFALTIGQFVPLYFADSNIKLYYYISVFILLLISVSNTVFMHYSKQYVNKIYAVTSSFIVSLGIVLILGFVFLLSSVAVWTDATVLYTNRNNPNVKIVSRYINLGAFGGGTEPSDYHIVVKRPITAFLKLETAIDTNIFNKSEWVKGGFNKYDTVIHDKD